MRWHRNSERKFPMFLFLLGAVSPAFIVTGMLGVMMMALAVIGNVAKLRRFKFMELDSILMVMLYLGGMYILYQIR